MSDVPAAMAKVVDARDLSSCVRCGVSLTVTSGSRHHRLRRQVGGHRVSNLILLCGSGATRCHGWVHSQPSKARALGLIIPANRKPLLDPALVPIFAMNETGSRGWFMQDNTGGRKSIPIMHALELLDAFGMLPSEVSV